MSVNSRLKTTKIIGQRKAFYRQIIPESSCTRKEAVDRDILVISRNDDRKIMQSIWIRSRSTSRKRKWNPVEPVLKNIYESSTYRKDLVTFRRWAKISREAAKVLLRHVVFGTLGMPDYCHWKPCYLLQWNFDSSLHAKNWIYISPLSSQDFQTLLLWVL